MKLSTILSRSVRILLGIFFGPNNFIHKPIKATYIWYPTSTSHPTVEVLGLQILILHLTFCMGSWDKTQVVRFAPETQFSHNSFGILFFLDSLLFFLIAF